MMTEAADKAAALLLDARKSGRGLPRLPADVRPASREEAYAIQDIVSARIGSIGGWKTAPAKGEVKFNWAPIPATGVYRQGADIVLSEFPRTELELEVGFVLGRDLPPRATPYDLAEVTQAIASMNVCLEIFCSRYEDRKAADPMEVLADGQNAAGAVVGTGVADWQDNDLGALRLRLDMNGTSHAKDGGPGLSEVLQACVDLANGTGRLGGLKAGHVIITGARLGPFPMTEPGPVSGSIDGLGTVQLRFV